jgi:hypothetical protein
MASTARAYVALTDRDAASGLSSAATGLEAALDVGATDVILGGMEAIAVAISSSDAVCSARLLGVADAVRADRQRRLDPIDQEIYAPLREAVRGALGAEAFDRSGRPAPRRSRSRRRPASRSSAPRPEANREKNYVESLRSGFRRLSGMP